MDASASVAKNFPATMSLAAARKRKQAMPPGIDFQRDSEGHTLLRLTGSLDITSTAEAWQAIENRLREIHIHELVVDASGVETCDGAGMALLHHLGRGGMTPDLKVHLRGLRPEFERMFRSFETDASAASAALSASRFSLAEDVGEGALSIAQNTRQAIEFIGEAAISALASLKSRRDFRIREVLRVFQLAGVNALPIVSLISFLVGLIIAFQAAQPLAQFGAQIFIANMIGLMMTRELGPLMTAILLAGRSGSAFAAELGTMKVNEELNALETMGLDPMRFLILPRIIAGVLLAPLLTLYSMFMGVLGGVVVMVGLGFPLAAVWNQLITAIAVGDLLLGAAKGLVFGLIVAAVGCQRGLQTKKGPSAVGEATTRSVVSGILLIIIADAVIALLAFLLKL